MDYRKCKQVLYVKGINIDTADEDGLTIRECDDGLLLEMSYTQIKVTHASLKQLQEFLIDRIH